MWRTFGVFLVTYMFTTMFTLVAVPRAIENLRQSPWLWGVPVLSVLAIANIPRAIYQQREGYAFMSSMATIAGLLCLVGAALFPNLVPSVPHPERSLTVWNAASSEQTLWLMLILAAVAIPLILAYTATLYWTFHGKVRLDDKGPY